MIESKNNWRGLVRPYMIYNTVFVLKFQQYLFSPYVFMILAAAVSFDISIACIFCYQVITYLI